MAEHLKKLLQLGKLSDPCLDVLRNLSLLSASGVLKNAFKNWLKLPSLNDVNYLAKYGFKPASTDKRDCCTGNITVRIKLPYTA